MTDVPDREASLGDLEAMLEDFYGPTCTNLRRKEIDDVLSSFFEHQACLSQALFFLSTSSQDYARTFAINVLQACVCHNWPKYTEKEHLELRYYTRQFLLDNIDCLQYYVVNKLCKLIADIGRNEWPEKDPGYFDFVMGLIYAEPTRMSGLILLRSSFEEFITPKEPISVARKSTLTKLLLDAVPNVLDFLQNLLEATFEKKAKREEAAIATECLQTVAQMMSWIPLTAINNGLIICLLKYTQCQTSEVTSPSSVPDESLQLLAMDCVNEIMAKRCVPKDVQTFLFTIFSHSMTMLTSGELHGESFLLKLVYYLQLLVSTQFARFEGTEGFPMQLFLQSVLHFTFEQEISEVYLCCLEIWSELLEYLKFSSTQRSLTQELKKLYRETVVELNSRLFARIMFATNHAVLDELDDETIDDDEETEYEKFQRLNLAIVVLSCELFPKEILTEIYGMFSRFLNDFKSIVSCVESSTTSNQAFELVIKAEYDNLRLHCKLRDLATVSRLVGMVNGNFLVGNHADGLPDSLPRDFVSGLLAICHESIKYGLFEISGSGLSEALHSDFSNLLALSLGSLQLMTNWVSSFLGQSVKLEDMESVRWVESLTSDCFVMTNSLIQGFNAKRSVFLRLMTQVIFSHSSTVRAGFLLKLPSVQDFLRCTVSSEFGLVPHEVQDKCVQSCTLIIVSSWSYSQALGSCEFQEWDNRSIMFTSWVAQLLDGFRNSARQTVVSGEQTGSIIRGLRIITGILGCLSGEVKRAREVCLTALQNSLDDTVILCSLHFSNPMFCGYILDVFHTVLDTVKNQLGAEKTMTLVDTLVSQLTPARVQGIFCRSSSDSEVQIISKFIKTLMRIVEEPGQNFRAFLPVIIQFIVETIVPLISEENYYSPDCIATFLDLVFQILNLHWKRFFESGSVINREHFVRLVEVFGRCLCFPDIHVFKHSLNGLQRLNEVHSLYSNEIFLQLLQNSFIKLLITSLIDKQQQLNEEEIIGTLHSMATVNFDLFLDTTVFGFLATNVTGISPEDRMELLNTFKRESDLPTFSASVKQLINDLNYLKLVNASLSEVSVNFTSLTQ